MGPKLKSLLARATLVGGVAVLLSYVTSTAPHDQTLVIRAGSRGLEHLDVIVTRLNDDEPTVGFSQAFPGASPHTLRHTFSAPNGTYIVVITLKERRQTATGDINPIPTETTFERRVNLAGGEVIVSPD